MSEYNIDSVSRLMNENLETPTTKHKEIGDAKGSRPEFLRKKNKTPKENPFAKKEGKDGNPFANKDGEDGKKENPFAKKEDKDGKKENPFAKGGSVEESIDRLLHILEASDQNGMNEEEGNAELEKRLGKLPPKYVPSAKPGPALAAQQASSERVKAHLARTAGSGATCRACGQKIIHGGRHDYPSK
jgi:hypothetical protein